MKSRRATHDPAALQRPVSNLPDTRDVVLLPELTNNPVRIIPTDGRPHVSEQIRQWSGDSRGQWDGDTLVVETRNFTDKTAFRGSSRALRVVERFTRIDPDTIRYEFTVEDETSWARPWSAEIPMARTDGPLYEYACHEGTTAWSIPYVGRGGQIGKRAEHGRPETPPRLPLDDSGR